MSTQYNVIGKPTPQLQSLDIVTGQESYSNDFNLPGQLYAKFVRSSQPHANITGIDTSAAAALPGVRGIMTYNDWKTLFPSLVDGRVRLIGDDVAVIAADTVEIAEQAVELISPTVKYQPLQTYFDVQDSLKSGAVIIWPGKQTATLQGNWDFLPAVHRAKGDINAGFASASVTVSQTFYVPPQFHDSVEPRSILVNWDQNNQVTMWASFQSLGGGVSLARSLGLPINKVRCICPRLGAGFGGKGPGNWGNYLAYLSKNTGRPVKFVATMDEENVQALRMNARYIDTKVGTASDGTLAAIQCNTLLDNGANTGGLTRAQNSVTGPFSTYECPNIDVTVNSGLTNSVVRGAYRGYGNTKQQVALGTTMDRVAEKLNMNPMDFYTKVVVKTGDLVCKRDTDPLAPLSSCGFQTQIPNLRAASGWDTKWHAPGANTLPNGNKHGIGMACRMHWAAMMPNGSYSAASVMVESDGSVRLFTGAADIGGGQTTCLAMIAAETLGVSLASVRLGDRGDTATNPYHDSVSSSRTTYVAGNAVINAANDAKQQLFALAAPVLKVPVSDLGIKNGVIYAIDNSSNSAPISSLIGNASVGQPCDIIGRGSYVEQGMPFSSGVVVAEVEVDTGTGEVIVDNIWGATDSGFTLNPGMTELQEQGGQIQGVGYVLTEAYILDTNTGKCLTMGNPIDNRVVTIAPQINKPYVAQPIDPLGPYGAKGIGEAGLMGTPAAIINAIYNAIGVRFTEMPITPDKVLLALGAYQGSAYSEVPPKQVT